jgi:methionyl-tRNA formyltransferase
MKWAFFGSSEFSVYVLDELKIHGILPNLIVTTPDKPKGRKLTLTPTPVRVWAEKNNISFYDPKTLKDGSAEKFLKQENWDLFLVASYGKIIPFEIFEIPKHKTLNIHPSLLPKYRGASPIQSQILKDEKEIGVTIMQIDEGMDTGAIVIQKKVENFSEKFYEKSLACATRRPEDFLKRSFSEKFFGRNELEKILAIEGARLFVHILPEWMEGAIDPIMQNEEKATYCEKITKEDGKLEIDLNNLPTGEDAYQDLLKIRAFENWPTAYFFLECQSLGEGGLNNKRIIITDATIENPSTDSTNSLKSNSEQIKLRLLKVKPEGKNEMPFEDFLRGLRNTK